MFIKSMHKKLFQGHLYYSLLQLPRHYLQYMEMSPANITIQSDLIYKELRGFGSTTFELDFQTHS